MLPQSEAIRATAKPQFVRLMIAVVVIGVLMVAGALVYLAQFQDMPVAMVVAVVGGVFVSIVLGAGLMAAGFYSSRSGHDDDATLSPGKPVLEI